MKFCENCGNEIKAENEFCTECGQKITGQEENWALKLALLSALKEEDTRSLKASMTIEELKTLVQAKSLKKLSTISNILIFFLVAFLIGIIVTLITVSQIPQMLLGGLR